MSDTTKIAWCDHTFNPWMGCVKVSDGCKHCYAETLLSRRGSAYGNRLPLWGPAKTATRQVTSASYWRKPHGWNRDADRAGVRRRVFSGSLCDVFEDHPIPNATRATLWQLIAATPALDWLLLTKRPERIAECLPPDWGDTGWANVWLGTSVEDMRVARRADHLRQVPAVVRFISYEPALGPLDDLDLTGLDWVIYGGESGPGYRAHDLAWPRAMRDKCRAAGVAWFYKQSAAPRTEMGITLDGELQRAWPTPRSADAPQSEPRLTLA